jgi:hypothetical protein
MQTKHTFLLTFILGLVWTGYLFANALGPEPARNGILGANNTCASAGCHVGNAVNAPGGSVTIDGLPATGWVAGQTYPLTVTVQRSSARIFGFQLSAVFDANNQQAGVLAAGNPRVQVICGRVAPANVEVSCGTAGAIQFAQHFNAQVVTSAYLVNWTAPAAGGTVRFNVAGNAANGDASNTGDFIYIDTKRVDPGAPPVTGVSSIPFNLADRTGLSASTDGSGAFTAGYARIQPTTGTTPSGVAIFGLKQDNIVVTEAGVPASPLLQSARIFAEVSSTVNTGVAIANPNDQPVNINFNFTDSNGADFGAGVLPLGPNQQTALFLNEAPFSVGRPSFQGSFTISSSLPVSMIALRGFFNERAPSDFLITTLPITNLAGPVGNSTLFLPHFADGTGWTTQIVLVNPTDTAIAGSIQFFGQGTTGAVATPTVVTANGQTASSFNYSIAGKTAFKLVTAGTSPLLQVGSVRVTPSSGAAPSALVVFSNKPGPITVSEAGVPAILGSAFRMYAETTAVGGIGAIQTGFAIANAGATETTVNLEVFGLDGSALAQTVRVVPGNGQFATFLHEVFPGLPLPFKGILRISGGGVAGVSVVGLRGRYNERGDFLITTTPPINESTPATANEQLFPHLINGVLGNGIWTTQFVLFTGTAGQTSTGNLQFIKNDATPLNLTVN